MTEPKTNSTELLREILSELEAIRDTDPRLFFKNLNELIDILFSEQ